MDLDKEIAKCEKKLDLARLNLQKIVKIESQPGYEETVPANVRTANSDKVRTIFYLIYHDEWFVFFVVQQKKTVEAEISTLEMSKNMFVQLK